MKTIKVRKVGAVRLTALPVDVLLLQLLLLLAVD